MYLFCWWNSFVLASFEEAWEIKKERKKNMIPDLRSPFYSLISPKPICSNSLIDHCTILFYASSENLAVYLGILSKPRQWLGECISKKNAIYFLFGDVFIVFLKRWYMLLSIVTFFPCNFGFVSLILAAISDISCEQLK